MTAPAKGFTGKSTVLSIGSGGTNETFTPILNMRTWQFSGVSAKYEDSTSASSTASGAAVVEEAVPSTISPGTMACGGVYIPSDPGQMALAAAFSTQALTDFQIVVTTPAQTITFTFPAYVQDMPNPDLDYSKLSTFKTTLKLNALPSVNVVANS